MKKHKQKKSIKLKIIIAAAVILAAAAAVVPFWINQNNDLTISSHTVENAKIPQSFDGFKIVQLSDLHNKSFGENNAELINIIKELSPDAVFITGDMIDAYRTDMNVAWELAEQLVKIAPVYYAAGNHEAHTHMYDTFKDGLLSRGVCVLDDASVKIYAQDGSYIELFGCMDRTFIDYQFRSDESVAPFAEKLKALSFEKTGAFSILLSHRPELIEIYARCGFDLVFSGHAHGGQWRFPLIGPVFSPNQGFFPKYTSGMYMVNGTQMAVSRGLGNSTMPIRLFNKPDVVEVTLKAK